MVAQQVGRDVSAVNRDLAILGEHGLVSRDKLGESRATPLGKQVASVLARGGLHYEEALRHISTLMEACEPVAGVEPSGLAEEEARLFFWLQESIVRLVGRIVASAEPPPLAQTLTQKFHEDLWANAVEIEVAADPWDLARKVWAVLDHYMISPPSQQVIRADIEGLSETDVLEALSMSLAAYQTRRHELESEGPERI